MVRRGYNQYCGLATALDIIGERWTMLIVRNLLPGPQRYKDLLEGLPGIGTNLLAERMKSLEAEDIVRKRTLPPPSGSVVYELTERGESLEPAITALAVWGFRALRPPDGETRFQPRWALIGIKNVFAAALSDGPNETYELRIGDDTFTIAVNDGEISGRQGEAESAAATLTTDETTFFKIASSRLSAARARDTGKLTIEGEKRAAARLGSVFGIKP